MLYSAHGNPTISINQLLYEEISFICLSLLGLLAIFTHMQCFHLNRPHGALSSLRSSSQPRTTLSKLTAPRLSAPVSVKPYHGSVTVRSDLFLDLPKCGN